MNSNGITTGIMLQGGDLINSTQSIIDDIIQNTPYTPVNPEDEGGGDGGEDPEDSSIPKKDTGNIGLNDISNLSIGGVASFLTNWVLTNQQISYLGNNLWSKICLDNAEGDAMIENFYKIRKNDPENPADYELTLAEIPDYFVSLKWFPFDVPSTLLTTSSGEAGIRVGTGKTLISTGGFSSTQILSGTTATLNGGTVQVPYSYESYLDLEPYTSASIYVPYCGTTEVQPSLIMGRTLTLTYAVNTITGSVCAVVMVQSGSISYPLCVLHGYCGFDIAISGNT
jgi:hypothetical protein